MVAPRIRLEVMGKYQISLVLGLTYFAVVLAMLSGIYELRIGTNTIVQSGAACPISAAYDISVLPGKTLAVIGTPCTVGLVHIYYCFVLLHRLCCAIFVPGKFFLGYSELVMYTLAFAISAC